MRLVRPSGVLFLLLIAAVAPVVAEPPDTPEPGSVEAIAAATTEPRFLSPWVASVPFHPNVPSPTKHLGHIVGAPGELSNTTKIYAYYRALAAATRRVRVETIGRSEEGREILLVIVGDEKDLDQLDRHRQVMADLADPRRTGEARAEELIAVAKPFYMLHGGLHSAETGSPEMLMELCHRLAISEAPEIREIRDKLIVLINPVAEPDGRDKMVDWFYRHLKGKTDFENLPPLSPPYWGKYVRHDNNRDAVQRKLALTRATQDAFLRWHPLVVHDLHESVPLLTIWTGTGPYNVNLDPSVFSEWHTIAFQEVATLTAMGMPGVWTYGFGEGWAHLYQDSVATNHNAIGRGYETFGNATAETVERTLDPERNRFTGRPVTESDWYHDDVLHSRVVHLLRRKNGSWLLPLVFPEGCPTHPAYGAGHATVAGACVTVLKALFDESFVIPHPVVPDFSGTRLLPFAGASLRVGGELNKLASNVATGRNIAGVHWRSDARESLLLGERIAIEVLKDTLALCHEDMAQGVTFTAFDGTTITVTP